MLLLNKNYTDVFFDRTETKPYETLEIQQNKQMEDFSFNPSINVSEERKWMLAVTSFGLTGSISNITEENNSFSFSTPTTPSQQTIGFPDEVQKLWTDYKNY